MDVVKECRVLGKYAEVYVENFIAIAVAANVEGNSRSAMTALSASTSSVFGHYLLHDKLPPCWNPVECAIAIRPRCCLHRHEHGV